MDIVRYVLAISVIVSHVNILMGYDNIWWPVSPYTCVSGFFALSGFLIYPSYLKHKTIKSYVSARARRILPSYIFIVVACAVSLVAVSTLPVWEYFSSSGFWAYLAANLSFLNFLHPSLPGVFDSPGFVMPAVNGALWTMKVEWALYLTFPITALGLLRMKTRGRMALLWIIIGCSILFRMGAVIMLEHTGKAIYDIIGRQFFGQLSFFYMGVMLYFKRDWLVSNRWAVLVAVVALFLAEPYIPYGRTLLSPITISTAVVWLSIIGEWGRKLSRGDNVSYDIYLFHFPIIQIAVQAGLKEWPWWGSFLIVTAVTTVLAVIEWKLIGKPFYRRWRLRG